MERQAPGSLAETAAVADPPRFSISVSSRARNCLAALVVMASVMTVPPQARAQTGTNPISHIIIIMQENRSLDSYFGAFGITSGSIATGCTQTVEGLCNVVWPTQCTSQGVNGLPIDPTNAASPCVAPWDDVHDVNVGAMHSEVAAQRDLDDGITTAKLDGFVAVQAGGAGCAGAKADCIVTEQEVARFDAMGYHTADEIPNYWSYAQNYLLLDHMFEPVRSWSWLSHLYSASLWGANCSLQTDPATCVTTNSLAKPTSATGLPWANLFQLFDARGVSWSWYLGVGSTPDCRDDQAACPPQIQNNGMLSSWNPAKYFASVTAAKQLYPKYLTVHVPKIDQFYRDVTNCTLPNVSWVVPSNLYSEHPSARVTTGMEYVTSMVNAVMNGPACNGVPTWQSTAIFITWDDWGGFYDHVAPPVADCINGAGSGPAGGTPPCTNFPASSYPVQGYGLRVPALVISPWVDTSASHVNSAIFSFDQFAKLAEDWFAGGARLDPASLGSAETRPDLRDAMISVSYCSGGTGCPGGSVPVGDLSQLFNFTEAPLPATVLSNHIPTGLRANCTQSSTTPYFCTSATVALTWNEVAQSGISASTQDYVVRDGAVIGSVMESPAACPAGVCAFTDSLAPGSGAHLYRLFSVDGVSQIPTPYSAQAEVDE